MRLKLIHWPDATAAGKAWLSVSLSTDSRRRLAAKAAKAARSARSARWSTSTAWRFLAGAEASRAAVLGRLEEEAEEAELICAENGNEL